MTYRYNEVVLGLVAIVWGVTLCLSGDVFDALRRFHMLRGLYPDWVLGIVLLVPALGIIFRLPPGLRAVLHMILFGLWLFVGCLTIASGFRQVTVLVGAPYFGLALFHAGKFWRLRREVIPR